MPGTGEEHITTRDLILKTRDGALQHVSELHSGYLPLRFPLIHPYREQGWHRDMIMIDDDGFR